MLSWNGVNQRGRSPPRHRRPPSYTQAGAILVVGRAMRATWYVTVEVRPGFLPRPRNPRQTSTFETEVEAKNFARAKLREGLIVFAGTINPVTPRRTVPSDNVAAWVTEGQEH
jgi:hypothetical protein